ncbi:hypothetical protein ACE1ET_03245 [Saccharicrinis sp. FJH62]|uniref:hypothetical protein n=1 Tax=Saccharicrinis sp. FJH62 TaxID=3344657 RepID=UPI0035D438FE
MNINRENYELFIVDLLDGTISEDVKKELQHFLMENPDIWKEVQGLETTFLKPENISYPKKAALKQSVFEDEEIFNKTAVAYLENDITEGEKADFEAYINTHSSAKREFRLFSLTKLKPDLSVLFPDKDLLYHKTKFIPLFIRFGRIASVAAIFLIALFYFKPWHIRTQQAIEQQQQQKIAEISNQSYVQNSDILKAANNEKQNFKEKTDVKSESNSNAVIEQPPKVTDRNPVQTAYRSEQVEEITEDREEYKELKPKKAKPAKYILIVRPTIAANDNYIASNNEKAMQRFAKTGEKILNQGVKLDREQVEKGVLNVLKLASKDRINYETNNNGKVSKINVNSDLLAFTLPIRKNNKQ